MTTPIHRSIVARALTLAAALFVSACSDSVVESPLAVTTIDVTPTGTLSLTVGTKAQLRAVPKGAHGEQMTARAVTWQSGNAAVASVSASGEVTATGAGTTQVTATSGGQTSSAVSVVVTALSQITLSRNAVSFETLTGSVPPAAQTVSITNSGGSALSGLTVGTIQYGAGQPTGWLTATLTPTTAPSTLTLTPLASTGNLGAGTYTAVVPITATGSSNSPQNVTVTLVLSPAFDLIITGAGTGTGTVTLGTFTCTITNGTASGACGLRSPAGSTQVLTATPTGTSVFTGWSGACSGTATTCSLSMTADRTVTATFNPPSTTVIALTGSTVAFTAGQGGANPAVQTVGITNGGSGPLTGLAISPTTYTPGQPANWLAVSLSSTTAPANLNFQPTVGVLGPGTYTATVNVTSPVASNSPRTVTINFTVVAKPSVVTFAATAITFNGATLNGSIAQDGQAYTLFFEYSTSPTLATVISTNVNPGPPIQCPGVATCPWSQAVGGLITNTTYYYRIVATNAAGRTNGSIISFKTN